LNRLLSINPLLEESTSADHAEEGSQGKELSQTEILTHNTEYLDSELQGISRLLAVSIKLLPLQDKLETGDDLAVYEKALLFMGRIIEFFLSESFDDELGGETIYSCLSLFILPFLIPSSVLFYLLLTSSRRFPCYPLGCLPHLSTHSNISFGTSL
jgi:hypothetical protein